MSYSLVVDDRFGFADVDGFCEVKSCLIFEMFYNSGVVSEMLLIQRDVMILCTARIMSPDETVDNRYEY